MSLGALRAFAGKADEVVPDTGDGSGFSRSAGARGSRTGPSYGHRGTLHIEVWNPDRWASIEGSGTDHLAEAIALGHGLGPRA
ncbi:MAG: hypothetical protein R2695_15980 [Acidimicrobiales bacterium]